MINDKYWVKVDRMELFYCSMFESLESLSPCTCISQPSQEMKMTSLLQTAFCRLKGCFRSPLCCCSLTGGMLSLAWVIKAVWPARPCTSGDHFVCLTLLWSILLIQIYYKRDFYGWAASFFNYLCIFAVLQQHTLFFKKKERKWILDIDLLAKQQWIF